MAGAVRYDARAVHVLALIVLSGLIAATLGWAGVASAHVTVSPSSLPEGTGDAILTFWVPNESPDAGVSGLKIQFPPRISHRHPVPGGRLGVADESGEREAPETDHDRRREVHDDGGGDRLERWLDPGGPVRCVQRSGPGSPYGTNELVFKALQLYSNGTTVSWIQIPDKDVPNPLHPAPILQLTRGGGTGGTSSSTASAQPTAGLAPGGGNGLSILALIAALMAVVVAGLAEWLGRPRVRSD